MSDIIYSIIIPVYNEEKNLKELHDRLIAVLERLDVKFEIIFIDDGSFDESLSVLKRLQQNDSRVKIIKLMRNFGQHPAMMAGFRNALGEIIVTMDADLQHPPEEIPKFVEKMSHGYDIVCGKRTERSDSFMRKIASKITNKLISRFIGISVTDIGCNLRMYRRKIVDHVKRFNEKSYYINVLTSWLGKKVVEIEINSEIRRCDDSRYNLFSLLMLFFDIITGFSTVPLRAISFIGIIMSMFGSFLGITLIVVRYAFKNYITDLSVLIAILLILFGVQLFGLGIAGEYIGRIYKEAKNRPDYIIDEIIQKKEL